MLSGELGRGLLLFMRSQFSSCAYFKIFLVSSRLVVIIIIAVTWINRDRFCILHGRKLEVWESIMVAPRTMLAKILQLKYTIKPKQQYNDI